MISLKPLKCEIVVVVVVAFLQKVFINESPNDTPDKKKFSVALIP